jgi:5-methylcytosine-specific restriction protein A
MTTEELPRPAPSCSESGYAGTHSNQSQPDLISRDLMPTSRPTGQHHHLYITERWKALRRLQLQREPLCAYCLKQGKHIPATIADHVVPHNGDGRRFFEGKLQSLCKRCHDGAKKSEEKLGYSTAIGVDGRPIDPKHPANK